MSISVVVPVLNEERWIGACLDRLRGCDVVVADGGSTDGTLDEVRARGWARVVASRAGRGAQMNAGASAAAGDVLLFLHVDTTLPEGALQDIARALEEPAIVGGGFLKRYAEATLPVRVAGFLLNHVRARVFRDLVGTNALFVRASVFRALGGFREWPLLEDVDFCDRLKQAGRLAVLAGPVTVSARKYTREGALRRLWINARVMFGYRVLGRAPGELASIYRGPPPISGLISVVIPTLNEEERLPECLQPIAGQPNVEVLVADGGSTDRTREIAASFPGVRVISCGERGRAAQMNAAAREARGVALLFLHADCRVAPEGLSGLRSSPSPAAFPLRLDGHGWRLRLIELLANARARWLGLSFGDQGLFVDRETFLSAGGFPAEPFLEDLAILRRIPRVRILPGPPLTASARRFVADGPLRRALANLLIVLLYSAGISPGRLLGLYDRRLR